MLTAVILGILQVGSGHEFVYRADPAVKTVSVAGSFNAWNKDADPMAKAGDTWRLKKQLSYGEHQYKFVLDGTTWISDPNGKPIEDGNGNTNSLLVHVPDDFRSPAAPNDGQIATSLVRHELKAPHLSYDRGHLVLRIDVRPDDLQRVEVTINGTTRTMEPLGGDDFARAYQTKWPWDGNSNLRYTFTLVDGKKTMTVGQNGAQPAKTATAFTVTSQTIPDFPVPAWVERSVFYQVFPDRFDNGDPTNDPSQTTPWDGTPTFTNFMGGDLAGVEKRIPYLKTLGINAIYFNPVFAGPSNHGYLTDDYMTIEPRLGTNEQFKNLVSKLHQGKIKVVLDGVFNHTSPDFFAFADILSNQKQSKHLDWYFVKGFPVQVRPNPLYEGWAGHSNLPKLNMSLDEPQKYFLEVSEFWMTEAKIDGWRLDVANEVDPDFWRKFRRQVKSNNPEAWILGENWTDSSPWLQGDQWDSSMNYPFRNAVLGYVAKKTLRASQFVDRLFGVFGMYSPAVSRNMLNALGSHDTPRFLFECGGEERLARLGAIVLMTWVGAPTVYYGDELGMTGGQDPANRRGMEWERVDGSNQTLDLYTRLIKARLGSEALMVGDPVRIMADDKADLVAYGRTYNRNSALVVLNRSDKHQTFRHVLTGDLARNLSSNVLTDVVTDRSVNVDKIGLVSLELPPYSGAVLLPRPPQGQLQQIQSALNPSMVIMQ